MIQRDGKKPSLWQASASPYVSSDAIDRSQLFDVIIVGGGITGITTALKLQQGGKKCVVLEAANLCFGTTGGTTAHLNTLLDTPYSTIEKNFGKATAGKVAVAAKEALQLIRSNIKDYQITCGFEEARAYLFAENAEQVEELENIYAATARAGIEVSYESVIPFPFTFIKAMSVLGQAKFNPVAYVYGLAAAFEAAGGCILQDCRVTRTKHGDHIIAETSCGNFSATNIIYTTHIPPGINLLHLRCAPYRSYALAAILADDEYPSDLAYDMEDPYYYYRSQKIDQISYLIAGGKDHKTGQEKNTNLLFDELEAHVKKYFRLEKIAYKWSSQYFEPSDGLPYIGHIPGQPRNAFTATGFGGNGMTYSHVAADVLNSIITEKENELIEVFNPGRIKPVAGFTNFVSHNVEVVGNFAGKLFSGEKLHELSGLAAGEGKVVQYEGEKIGLFKDLKGGLHAVNPVCTHMKCEVKWNGAEQSWDCPCHGARYNVDGEVITGPADLPLELINIGNLQK